MNGDGTSWRVKFELPDGACVAEFDAVLDAYGAAITAQEIDGGPRWRLTGHCDEAPDGNALAAAVAAAAARAGIAPPAVTVEAVPATDWVLEYQRRTAPVAEGRFFIYPSHYRGGVPNESIGIRLDAGLAFGTGEHQTTAGCLRALQMLQKEGLAVVRALDMGCGSAILAIAIARLWPKAAVLAVDNDPEAVHTAVENVADNGCSGAVRVLEGEGYRAVGAAAGPPFDLVVANILAGPLIAMATEAAARLAPAGRLVLSGLLSDQADTVVAAHRAAGLVPMARIDIDEWTTLVLAPGSAGG